MKERSQANTDLGERAGKAAAGLDQRHQRARGDVDALQHALPVVQHLAHEPVALVGVEERVVGQHLGGIALRLEDQHADLGLVEAQMQDGVVQLARQPQRPELRALLVHRLGRGRRRRRSARGW